MRSGTNSRVILYHLHIDGITTLNPTSTPSRRYDFCTCNLRRFRTRHRTSPSTTIRTTGSILPSLITASAVTATQLGLTFTCTIVLLPFFRHKSRRRFLNVNNCAVIFSQCGGAVSHTRPASLVFFSDTFTH
ncbi:hypothetical protein Hamer_G015542 [Homarus americanus]|uniref:Uncharacterized protein n=1 Tax=Homarus americanus TaxID=6706 RepID=A0A8J5TL74_HOMAM|nr:hypothetical protein Hamer_G015542 [Homarus americanus]